MEAVDRNGQTPLNLAARHGYSDVVRVLLAAGARADHADCDGWTALRAAAWGGHTQVELHLIAKFLREKNVNFINSYKDCDSFLPSKLKNEIVSFAMQVERNERFSRVLYFRWLNNF